MQSNEKWLSLVRHIVTFIGGIVIWKGWVGEDTIEVAIGAVMTLVGLILSWNSLDKETRLEQAYGVVRHIVTTLAGVGLFSGFIDEQTVLSIVSVIFAIIGGGWGFVSKKDKIVKLEPVSKAAA